MYFMLLGAPGVGKGTQAQRIMNQYHIPQISTGDILRAEVKAQSDLGLKVESIMNNGELVSDDLILKIVEKRLNKDDCANGFILDGFPRTIPQAAGLDIILHKLGISALKVLEISVSDEEILNRLLKRGREDDREDIIKNRLEVYRKQTFPLIEFYSRNGSFYKINGQQAIDEVFNSIRSVLNNLI